MRVSKTDSAQLFRAAFQPFEVICIFRIYNIPFLVMHKFSHCIQGLITFKEILVFSSPYYCHVFIGSVLLTITISKLHQAINLGHFQEFQKNKLKQALPHNHIIKYSKLVLHRSGFVISFELLMSTQLHKLCLWLLKSPVKCMNTSQHMHTFL